MHADSAVFLPLNRLYATRWKLLDGGLGIGLVVPYVWMEIDATWAVHGRFASTCDTREGFGDLLFLPLMLGWQRGDSKSASTLGVCASAGARETAGDSGKGGRLADCKGRRLGIGPLASYGIEMHDIDVLAEAQWLPEREVEHRLEGDSVHAKLGVVF